MKKNKEPSKVKGHFHFTVTKCVQHSPNLPIIILKKQKKYEWPFVKLIIFLSKDDSYVTLEESCRERMTVYEIREETASALTRWCWSAPLWRAQSAICPLASAQTKQKCPSNKRQSKQKCWCALQKWHVRTRYCQIAVSLLFHLSASFKKHVTLTTTTCTVTCSGSLMGAWKCITSATSRYTIATRFFEWIAVDRES